MTKNKTGSGINKAAMAIALSLGMTLTACGDDAPVEEAAPADTIPGVTIENARMVLAPVEGNPAAVYFDFSYDGDRAFSLGRVSVEGTESAMMHQFGEYDFKVQMMEALPIPVTNGTKVEFKPGDYHVMAMGVSPDIKPGDTVEVTLTISGGDKQKFAAEVRAAGEER